MAKNTISSVIAIDSNAGAVSFCVSNNGRLTAVHHSEASCKMCSFNGEFFARFGEIVKEFPRSDFQKTGIILPDRLFLNDTVSVPLINRRALNRSLTLAINTIYKNADDMILHTYPMMQNKQYATYGLVGIRKETLSFLKNVCEENNIIISGISSVSSCLANGVAASVPKLKNATYLFLDIKEDYSRFVFVMKGYTVGCYDLPFGYSVLSSKGAEINSSIKEKRSLPDIQSSEPCCAENYLNFRIFVKWSLELIANNKELIPVGALDTVYVNMPEEYFYFFDMVNAEKAENKVTFANYAAELADKAAAKNIELLGGFYIGQYNKIYTF